MKGKKQTNHTIESKHNFNFLYPQIIELLRLLAAPFDVQISAFPKNEFPPDEIADEIDCKCSIAKSFLIKGAITSSQYESINFINEKLESFCKEDWTLEAMEQSSNWAHVRELAMESLGKFEVEYAKPNLYWYPLIEL